jgi:hypothetical protein
MLIPKPLKGESRAAYRAFQTYVELGSVRTMQKVANRLSCSLQNIKRFAIRHKWPERLAMLVAEEAEREAEAERQARLEAAKEREQMRLSHEKRMLKLAESSWTRLEQFANLPVVRSRKVEEIKDPAGHTISQTIIVEPAGINWSSYARAVGEFDKIVRLVLGMPTGKQELVGADGAPLLQASAPVINVVVTRDETSDKVRGIQADYLREHPEHPQAERFLRQYESERDAGNGE